MNETYYVSHHKPGRPASLTLHTLRTEEEFSTRAADLGLTIKKLVDKVLYEGSP